ncbi:uncharacterized protein LOC114110263 isoform X1 [Ovis aries]|uniref:Uncharacterized protein n=4 Tax=Ovis TaxID=9935 RepID=A0AC11DC58_SHEEP|nr:uncharacterized protein LOC114110263 isoform X1 [Ovis aries]
MARCPEPTKPPGVSPRFSTDVSESLGCRSPSVWDRRAPAAPRPPLRTGVGSGQRGRHIGGPWCPGSTVAASASQTPGSCRGAPSPPWSFSTDVSESLGCRSPSLHGRHAPAAPRPPLRTGVGTGSVGTTLEALGAQEAQRQPLPPRRLDAAGERPLPLGGTRGRPGAARMGSCAGEEGGAPGIPPLRPGDQFHLFVSYSSVDAVWTHGLTGRLEAELPGLRVCLHERDFTPGRNVLENMAGCIQQSQKVLLVLSEDFVQSRWCLLEADLSLVGSCLERKPVLPVLLRPCRVPLHLSHLTYLEATDGRFFQKLVQLLCTPNQRLASPPALRSAPALYSGKALLTLDCINRDSLSSWEVGSFSTLAVPDALKEVLEDPELYKRAVGILNGVRSPRCFLRYLGCRVILAIALMLLAVVSLFLPLVLGLRELHPAQRLLVISANVFFCPFFLILSVNTLCWLRRSSRRTLRELACRVGEANLLLAPHSVLVGCETKNKLYFVYVVLGDCKRAFLGAPEGEAAFQEAILRFSSSYACCLAHAHFPHWEEAAGAPGHLEVGLCFCQFVSLQLRRLGAVGVNPV